MATVTNLGPCVCCGGAGGTMLGTCCSGRTLPATLFATFAGGNTPCPSNGQTIALTWNAVTEIWEGSGVHSGVTTTVKVSVKTNLKTGIALTGSSSSCASFSLNRDSAGGNGCTTGGVDSFVQGDGDIGSGDIGFACGPPLTLSYAFGSPGSVTITE